jgi:hypothetical protein
MKLLNVGLPGQEIPCLVDSSNSILSKTSSIACIGV